MYPNGREDDRLGLLPLATVAGGITAVTEGGNILSSLPIVGGLFGKKTWQETTLEKGVLTNVGSACRQEAEAMAALLQYATDAEWETLHQANVRAGYRHLAQAAYQRDPVAFASFVYQSDCTPNRVPETRMAVELARRIGQRLQSQQATSTTPPPPTPGAPPAQPPTPGEEGPTQAGMGDLGKALPLLAIPLLLFAFRK